MTHRHEIQPYNYKCSACGCIAMTPDKIEHGTNCGYVRQENDSAVIKLISDTLIDCRRDEGMGTIPMAKRILDALHIKGWIK